MRIKEESVANKMLDAMAQEEIWLKSLLPQPKAKWSEEDEGVLKDAICATDILGNDESFNKGNPNLGKAFRVAKDWLKSLPERFNLQPKQEWSEEDSRILYNVIAYVGYAAGQRGVRDDEFKEANAWLKSLRPQPKQELFIEKAIQWFEDTFHFQNNSSGRGEDYEITTHDFDSMEEMYESFRKSVIIESQRGADASCL